MATKDYEVGHGKPPKAHQFKPGQSGNPKGRPKGTKNLATDLQEELEEIITIIEGGVELKTSKQRAMVKTLFAKALNGNVHAADSLIKLIVGLIHMPETDDGKIPDEDDLAVIETFKQQLLNEAQSIAKGDSNDEE